jgi:two-component system, response regulator YesN
LHTILVIEDFFVDRENLKELLGTFKDLEIEVIGSCENGNQALEFISKNQPEIIISDIEMPGMNGFEMARIIRKEYPNIKMIFCTLYNQFEYAKTALCLDGYGYILKPVDSNELRECITRVIGLITTQTQQTKENDYLRTILYESKPILIENFIRELVYGLNNDIRDIWDRIEFLKLDIKEGMYSVALLEIDDYEKITSNQTIEQKQIFSVKVYERIKKAASGIRATVLTRIDDFHFVIISNLVKAIEGEECIKVLSEICNKLLREFYQSDISISIAVSSYCKKITEIYNLFEQCNYILRYKYSLGKGKIIHNRDIPSSMICPDINYNAIQKEIRFLLNSGNSEEIGLYIDQLFENIPGNAGEQYLKNFSFCFVICIQTVLSENNDDFKRVFDDDKLIWEKLLKFETILDVRNWLKNLAVFINEYLMKKNSNKNKVTSTEVKRYVEKNYKNDLSLEVISADLFYSPNYLNNIFKQETGDTIYEYVCKYRIEKAKEMLSDPRVKLYEVADSLGYSHTAYFSNVFKKYAGLTPKAYRERRG